MTTMLQIRQLHAHYDKSHVLHGVDLAVRAGEIVALLGRNGSGRSTTLKAVMGLGQVSAQGSVCWQQQELLGRKSFEIARLGIGYVPESRDIFPRLSVHQNLLLGEKPPARGTLNPVQGAPWRSEDMYALFPALRARQHTAAGVLSGGEQQMLTLCRTLMGNPSLVMVDEPTEGLAPRLVQSVADCLRGLRARGLGVLLVEQKLAIALEVADRCLVMGQGRIVFDGTPAALLADACTRQEWLAV